MGHFYTNTMPLELLKPEPTDRVHQVLRRRIEASRERRLGAALSPGNDEDFDTWQREVRRVDSLVRALTRHITRPIFP